VFSFFSDPMGNYCKGISPSWIEKVLTVIACNWTRDKAGNSSGWMLENAPIHSHARKTNS